jgi:[protein-PII] uridylyltransferase
MPIPDRSATARYSSFLWRKLSASEQEKRTKTLFNSLLDPEQIVQHFIESRHALLSNDLHQHSGFFTTRRYTDLMDRFIRALFLASGFRDKAKEIAEEQIAVAALGSYGRREICLGSDVDLLVVHKGALSLEMEDILSRVLYPLWDAKLDVGHAVLTVQESFRLARSDFRFLTAAMDARFLVGSRSFFRLFEAAFWSKIDREKDGILSQFLVHQQKRAERYGSEEYFLEPDIKEGLGGLRDLHFMAWTAKVFFKSRQLRDIKRFSVFSHFPLERLHHSESFLLKVRNHLHLQAGGRREDRLLLPYQDKISKSLGYEDGADNTGPEKFMRNLHSHLNRIRYGSEEFHMKAMDVIDPHSIEPSPDRLPLEFQVFKGNIVLKGEDLLPEDPLLILKAFKEANQRGLFLGSGFIWDARKKVATDGSRLVEMPGARKMFLDVVFEPKNPKILRLALEIGLINLFIPEFKKIRNLAQFSYYHVETVDLHSLRTLEVIYAISQGAYKDRWPLFQEVFESIEHPDWLFLVGLLHDVGKGYKGDHAKKGAELIPGILKRVGIHGDALEVIPFLVRNHLLMVNVSQRRDLNEEKTAIQVAQAVQGLERLKLLFLLTVADSMATGPMASSDWKMMLLIELFFKVRRILERGTLASPDATKRMEKTRRDVVKSLSSRFGQEDILELMDQVSTRYFLNSPMEDMVRHFQLALTMGEQPLAWTLEKLRHAPVTRVILCTHDKPGLFSKMVGVFTLNGIEVLSGNVFTLKNGLAFDTYEVTNPLDPYREKERWQRIFNDALLAIEDRLPLDERINKKERTILSGSIPYTSAVKRVRMDNKASDFFTIIEVSGASRTSLLYDLAKGIHALGLDIRFAKVSSDRERMTGVFYVRDVSGQKIYEDSILEETRRTLISVME